MPNPPKKKKKHKPGKGKGRDGLTQSKIAIRDLKRVQSAKSRAKTTENDPDPDKAGVRILDEADVTPSMIHQTLNEIVWDVGNPSKIHTIRRARAWRNSKNTASYRTKLWYNWERHLFVDQQEIFCDGYGTTLSDPPDHTTWEQAFEPRVFSNHQSDWSAMERPLLIQAFERNTYNTRSAGDEDMVTATRALACVTFEISEKEAKSTFCNCHLDKSSPDNPQLLVEPWPLAKFCLICSKWLRFPWVERSTSPCSVHQDRPSAEFACSNTKKPTPKELPKPPKPKKLHLQSIDTPMKEVYCSNLQYNWDGEEAEAGNRIEDRAAFEVISVFSRCAEESKNDFMLLPASDDYKFHKQPLWLSTKDQVDKPTTWNQVKLYLDEVQKSFGLVSSVNVSHERALQRGSLARQHQMVHSLAHCEPF
mmetsp:Transcript_14518/g.35099  ORF Transcript_14518/g.35099 Transcript_14518/m.35099 type:complete len:420 (+) Transcript_14518:193-1452(+)